MGEGLYESIDPLHQCISPQVAVDLFDVHDVKIETIGTATLNIQFGNEILEHKFIITSGTSEPCILGMDGINRHSFCLNGATQTIFRLKNNEEFGSNGLLSLGERITIPPFSSKILMIHAHNKKENNSGKGDTPPS